MKHLTAPRTSARLVSAVAVAAVTGVLLAACGSSGGNPLSQSSAGGGGGVGGSATSSGSAGPGSVVIGSANFPENELLADIYAAALTAKGVKVSTQLGIGARELYYGQIKAGKIDILPEYNGALLAFLDKNATATTKAATDQALASKLPSSLGILNPSAAEDKDSLNVTKANATKDGLSSIADLSKVAGTYTLGGPPEFKSRRQGVLGLKSVYGLSFKAFKPLDEAGSLTISALKGGAVQVADIFSTDPSITTDNFVTLADPKGLFGAQNVTPLVYKAGVTGTVTDTLNAVSAKLDTPTLAKLVAEVVADHKDAAKVAGDFVSSAGLS